MAVKLVVAVTDGEWFRKLRSRPDLTEVNFWSPSALPFKALSPGELLLFKLRAPHTAIVGGGVFAHATELPCSIAWQTFGDANGAASFDEMRRRIARYRRVNADQRDDFVIGCRILTQPFFLREDDWLPLPPSWSPQTVRFKTYSTHEADGLQLWESVQRACVPDVQRSGFSEVAARYGEPTLVQPRLGQGAFRTLITDVYARRCVITSERTLPALEAAHIKPYAECGEHDVTNGLLFRRDVHALFDGGYVTVDRNSKFVVSRRIREEFENGRDYYALHGKTITSPVSKMAAPDPAMLEWHNEHCFKG